MKRDKDRKSSVQQLFDSILDVHDRTQIQTVISKAQTFKDRQFIINKIMQRREEISNAEQFVQFSRCAPLVNRFMKKMRQTMKEQPALKDPIPISQQNARRSSIDGQQKVSSDPSKSASVQSQRRQSLANKEDHAIPTIVLLDEQLDSNRNQPQQTQNQPTNNNETPKKSALKSQMSIGSLAFGSDSAENLLKKGITLSIFFKMKGKSSQSTDEINYQSIQSQQLNKSGSISDPSQNLNDNSVISSATPTAFIRKQNSMLRKTIIQRDNLLSRKTAAGIDQADAFESNLNAINMLSVSQSSRELEVKGKIQSRERANALLKDFQKANLASHFKSKSLNQQTFNSSEINTFNFKNRLLLTAKQPQAKTCSLHENQKLFSQEQGHAFSKGLTLSERQDLLHVVENELVNFVKKQEHPLSFLAQKSTLQLAEMNSIEQGARMKLLERTSQSCRNIQINHLPNNNNNSHNNSNFNQQYFKGHPYFGELPSTASSTTTRKRQQPSFFLDSKPCSPKVVSNYHSQRVLTHPTTKINSGNDPSSEQSDVQQVAGIPSYSEIAPHSLQQSPVISSLNYQFEPKVKLSNKSQQLAQMLIPIRKPDEIMKSGKGESFGKVKQQQQSMTGSFKRATFKQPFRMNNQEVFSPNSNFMEQKCMKFANYHHSKEQSTHRNSDLAHDSGESNNNSDSFASFTEIKLDNLYRKSNKLKNVLNLQKDEQLLQEEKREKDIIKTRKDIQTAFYRKFKEKRKATFLCLDK